jgi:hypothetical protein
MTDAITPALQTRRVWPTTALLIAFGLLYSLDFWEAVSNLLLVPADVASTNELLDRTDPVPWGGLIASLVLPVLVFIVAIALGRTRTLGAKALLLTAGLALVGAVSLSITAYVRAGGL